MEYKNTYCCYNSKMAKIFNEQGRKQLKDLDFGTAEKPVCRGFTPEEFQALDFSPDKIDLTEWFEDFEATTAAEINENITDKINNFYDKIRK